MGLGLYDLGGGALRRAALHPGRRDRRRHARPRPRARREPWRLTFVIGNAHRISASVLAPGTTISATIANEFTEAGRRPLHIALIALGLILFCHHLHRARGRPATCCRGSTSGIG